MSLAYLKGPRPRFIAHRGGTEVAAENTVEAFEAATRLGCSFLETDVHLSSDGQVVAFHDADLSRMGGGARAIAEMTWAEISEVRLAGDTRVPLMGDLLQRFPTAHFNIDPKVDGVVDALLDLLREHEALMRVALGSFSERRLWRIRRSEPRVATGLGPAEVARLAAEARGMRLPWAFQGAIAQVPRMIRGATLVDEAFVAAARRRHMEVHVWTVNEPAEMVELLDLGVDGIMTDRPSVLREVLVERGEWNPA